MAVESEAVFEGGDQRGQSGVLEPGPRDPDRRAGVCRGTAALRVLDVNRAIMESTV